MGHVSGFWLTWYYFGYSKVYGTIIALGQIAGGVLLMFRKTTLLAVCLLLPVLCNIVLIDIFYRIDFAALMVALLLLGALLSLLAMHKQELVELFWNRQNRLVPGTASSRGLAAGKWVVRVSMVVATAVLTYWTANYNNRAPTPIDGVWSTLKVEPGPTTREIPSVVFFERNRAHLCVFKLSDGSYQQHHFEANTKTDPIEIWEQRMGKGPRVFTGRYALSGTVLSLKGRFDDSRGELTIDMEKRH